jgi:hypothetical protein
VVIAAAHQPRAQGDDRAGREPRGAAKTKPKSSESAGEARQQHDEHRLHCGMTVCLDLFEGACIQHKNANER